MDIQNEKVSHERLIPHSFGPENGNVRHIIPTRTYLQNNNETEECSSRLRNLDRDSVEDIIQKYKDERFKKKYNKYSNQKLGRINGEHVLFHANTACLSHSVQNFFNYVKPNYLTISSNKDNHVSSINNDVARTSRLLNGNKIPKVTFIDRNTSIHKNMELCERTGLTSREKLYADKSTYCRPVASLYNEEFINKTMERNFKLKRLVKKLAIVREREQENVNWNNFINELKNKHFPSCNDAQHTDLPPLDIINDNHDTKTSFQKSMPCRHLLKEFYERYYDPSSQPTYINRRSHKNKQHPYSNHHPVPYSTDSHCYPTSSQGRLIVLEKEKRRIENQRPYRSSYNNLKYGNNHGDKKSSELNLARKPISRNVYSINPDSKNIERTSIESGSIQTNHYFNENIRTNKATNKTESVIIDELIQTCSRHTKIEEKHKNTASIMNTISLANIESKIETLIGCINGFINEIKLNRTFKPNRKAKAASVVFKTCVNTNTEINKTKSEIVGDVRPTRKDASVFGETFNSTSESTSVSNFYPCTKPSKVDDILKEIDRCWSYNNIMPFKSQPCSVKITFEVPTRDCSTEITKSLSKQHSGDKFDIIEEISTSEPTPMQQMTIAVNTDPFNFLTLLRISTDAVMRLISNVPNINYHSYLGLLPFPQPPRNVESHYICNICGTAFTKPSALSDHIHAHNLGKSRDCCVCRHVLDRTRASLFKCKFCGQRFTRAYCCELHQRRCAQLLGHVPDVASSLVLLR